jgi:hypothetical protein
VRCRGATKAETKRLMKNRTISGSPWTRTSLLLAVAAIGTPPVATAQSSETDSPTFTAEGDLVFPVDYRDWVYLSSGLGMTYGTPRVAEGETPQFDNIFVSPAAHREFKQSGTWPDGTIFILEVRNSVENESINVTGFTQGGIRTIEASVKDTSRFPGNGWAYFRFGEGDQIVQSSAPLPTTATCYACHGQNAAVDNTFVQFYPTLFEIATRLRTISRSYDPAREASQ